MTPKEKAQELTNKYAHHLRSIWKHEWHAKQCALIAVGEIIEAIRANTYQTNEDNGVEYWLEVKQEIEKL